MRCCSERGLQEQEFQTLIRLVHRTDSGNVEPADRFDETLRLYDVAVNIH